MSKIASFLFPLKRTFRRLELERRWWHRLTAVVFFVSLVPAFLYSFAAGYITLQPKHTSIQQIHHWGQWSNGLLFDIDSSQPFDETRPSPPPPPVQKTIEMPDGKTITFPGSTSDDAIEAEWTRNSHAAVARAVLLEFGLAIASTLVFGYFLQACYRAVLYVIYGVKARAASDTTG